MILPISMCLIVESLFFSSLLLIDVFPSCSLLSSFVFMGVVVRRDYYILGSSHLGDDSAEAVTALLDRVNPDSIMVELDKDRAVMLKTGRKRSWWDFNLPFGVNILKNIIQLQYSSVSKSGKKVGQEFLTAMEEAERRGIPVIYGDRSMAETLGNLWKVLKFKRVMQCPASPIQQLQLRMRVDENARRQALKQAGGQQEGDKQTTDAAALDMVMEETLRRLSLIRSETAHYRQFLPELVEVFVDSRDGLMAQHMQDAPGQVVVVCMDGC